MLMWLLLRLGVFCVTTTTLLTVVVRLIAPSLPDDGQIVYSTRPTQSTTHLHLFDVAHSVSVFIYQVDDIVTGIHWSTNGEKLLLISDTAQIHLLNIAKDARAVYVGDSQKDISLSLVGWLDAETAVLRRVLGVHSVSPEPGLLYAEYLEFDTTSFEMRDLRFAIAPMSIWQSDDAEIIYFADVEEKHIAQLNLSTGEVSVIYVWSPLELTYGSFQLSSDARFMSANGVTYSSAGKSDMFLLDIEAGEINKLTEPDSQSGSTNFWSARGDELVYLSIDSDGFYLNLVDIESEEQAIIHMLPRPNFMMRLVGWSPDDTRLGYVETIVGQEDQLCFLDFVSQTAPHCPVTLERRSFAIWRPE